MVISLLNQKGGVGKTTLALHLAAALQEKGSRVQLIDADPQGSALDWSVCRDNTRVTESPKETTQQNTGDKDDSGNIAQYFSVVGLPRATIHREVPHFLENYDHIIIDGPPRVYEVARSAILASDLVIIPVQPSPYDVWAAKEIIDLLKEASVFKENLKSRFTINRKIVNTAIGRDVVEALKSYETSVLQSHICQRVVFAESAASGQTVLETEPKGLASAEIRALATEILTL